MRSAVIVAALLAMPSALGGQVPRLHDPFLEPALYDLAESTALRAGISLPFASAKPWSSRDLAEILRAVDSAAAPSGPSRGETAAVAWRAGLLRDEVRFSAARLAGHAGVTGIEHLFSLVPRAAVFAAAGERELDPAFQSIRSREDAGDADAAAGGELHAAYGWLSEGISAALDVRGRTNARNQFDFRTPDQDGALDLRAGYALWQTSRFLIAAGRLPVEWGNGPLGGAGLSAAGPSLDGLLARARWGNAQLSILNAFLSDERANRQREPDGDTIESSTPPPAELAPLVNRYFHAHRLDLRLGDRFTLGIGEMAMVTGVRRRPEFQFLSGLVPYAVVQNSGDEIDASDVNLGGGLQYRWRLPGHVLLYGEYFANEIFLDKDLGEVLDGLLGRRSNTQGFQQGIRWAAPFGWKSVDLEAEIVRLEPFLYLHRGLNTNWRRNDVPLGAPLGPDNQRAVVRAAGYWPIGDALLRGIGSILWRERGIGRITDNDDIVGAGPPASVPREPVETSWLATIGGELWWPRKGRAGLSMTLGRIETADHTIGREIHPVDFNAYIILGPAWDHGF